MARYLAETCKDDLEKLQKILDRISAEDGRVINVMWQLEQKTMVLGEEQPRINGGFVVVSESLA